MIRAETEEEVLRQAAVHAAASHRLTEIDEATAQQIRSRIRSV